MQNVLVIQAFAYSDVIKRVVELTKQGYEVDYSARAYPRFVGNKYVVTMSLPEQEAVVEQEPAKKPARGKKNPVEGGDIA